MGTTSALLELEEQASGENEDTWGAAANTVLQLIENAVAGVTSYSASGGSYTLDDTDEVANEARKGVLRISGTLASNQTIVVPNRSKIWDVYNETSGAFTLTIATATPTTSATITQGSAQTVYCDGSDNVFYLGIEVIPTTGAPTSPGVGTQAANVSVNPSGNLTSTNAQDAFEEIQGDIDTINTGLATKQDASARLDEISALTPNKGTLIPATGSGWTSLSVGMDGQLLQADSAQPTGIKWVTPDIESDTPTKGHIWTADGAAFEPTSVGANGTQLVADSTQTNGVAWGVPGISSNTVTNAMLANVATDTVKGRNSAGTGDPEDVTMPQLATLLTADAAALALLQAAIPDFEPANDIRGSTETGSVTIPSAWVSYLVFGWLWDEAEEDPVIENQIGIWRSSVLRSVESTQAVGDYLTGDSILAGFIVCIKVT